MGDPRASRSQSQTWRTSPSSPNERDTERHLLRLEERMCLALAPTRLLLGVAENAYHYTSGLGAWRRHLGAHTHRSLRERLRRVLGREPTPSAAIIDSQSRPRPPTKEAHEATTVARKPALESDICSSIRKVW